MNRLVEKSGMRFARSSINKISRSWRSRIFPVKLLSTSWQSSTEVLSLSQIDTRFFKLLGIAAKQVGFGQRTDDVAAGKVRDDH